MRIGAYLVPGGQPLAQLVSEVTAAADAGVRNVFFAQIGSWDALTAIAVAAASVPGVDFGTAVVPTYPRHPLALASQALTVQAATGNRLTLGIGPSHRPVVEGQYGYSFARPAGHTREYLEVLRPLLAGEAVEHRGRQLTAVGRLDAPGVPAPSVLISALGPAMLRLAGELADGTVTVWATPDTVGEAIVPALTRSARQAGRPAPRVVATVMASVTADPDGVREAVAGRMSGAGELPSYRELLRRQGMAGVHETVVAGDEELLAHAVQRYAAAGVTDLVVSAQGTEAERHRTLRAAVSSAASLG
jgi:F420-dependent oxidoreductase-like protein